MTPAEIRCSVSPVKIVFPQLRLRFDPAFGIIAPVAITKERRAWQ
jgi:hypothetical protein